MKVEELIINYVVVLVVKSAKADPKRSMMKKLQQSGSVDDAADAFLAQWEN